MFRSPFSLSLILLAGTWSWAAAQSASPGPAPSPVTWPDSPLGRAAQALIETINRGDSLGLIRYFEQYGARDLMLQWTPQRYARMLLKARAQSGGLEVRRVRDLGNAVRVFTSAKQADRVLGIELVAGYRETDKVAQISLHLMDPAQQQRPKWPAVRTEAERIVAIESRIAELTAADRFSGVVLVARGDSVLVERAVGFSDQARQLPNTPDTRFMLTSVGKMFAAVAVAQLVESGKLRFDDTVAKVLPEYPDREAARRITIAQLLTHTAGVPEVFDAPGLNRALPYGSHAELLKVTVNRPLLMEPGSHWGYSNGGYATLGAIVERLSGQSYQDYLRSRIFQPAGMTQGLRPSNDTATGRAVPYAHFPEVDPLGMEPRTPGEQARDGMGARLWAFGGGYGSPRDLFRFVRALRNGRLVGRAMVDTLVTGRVPLGPGGGEQYAYGFYSIPIGDDRVVGHSGSNPGMGMDADVELLWDRDYTIIVLSNYDAPAGVMLAQSIVLLLAGVEPR
jgi:D-alanyl-D-alanine carboxypeptidase